MHRCTRTCRVLAPGNYTVTVSAPGYQPTTSQVLIPSDNKGVVQDWTLEPVGGVAVPAKAAGGQGGATEVGEGNMEVGTQVAGKTGTGAEGQQRAPGT